MALHLGTRSFLMEILESCDGGNEKKNQTYLVLVGIHLFWYFSEIRWELRQICESHSFWKISALGCSTVAHLEDTVLSRLSDPSAEHGDCEARSWSGGVWVRLSARIQDGKNCQLQEIVKTWLSYYKLCLATSFFLAWRVKKTLPWCVLHQIKCRNLGGNLHHHRPQRLPCLTMFHTLGMRWPNTPLVHPFGAAFLAVVARGLCNVSSLVAAPQWPCRVFQPTAMRNAFWPSKFASRISVVPKKWWSTSGPVSGRYLEDVVKHETKH